MSIKLQKREHCCLSHNNLTYSFSLQVVGGGNIHQLSLPYAHLLHPPIHTSLQKLLILLDPPDLFKNSCICPLGHLELTGFLPLMRVQVPFLLSRQPNSGAGCIPTLDYAVFSNIWSKSQYFPPVKTTLAFPPFRIITKLRLFKKEKTIYQHLPLLMFILVFYQCIKVYMWKLKEALGKLYCSFV